LAYNVCVYLFIILIKEYPNITDINKEEI